MSKSSSRQADNLVDHLNPVGVRLIEDFMKNDLDFQVNLVLCTDFGYSLGNILGVRVQSNACRTCRHGYK